MRDTAPTRIHVSVPDVLVVDYLKLPSRPVLPRKGSIVHCRWSLGWACRRIRRVRACEVLVSD